MPTFGNNSKPNISKGQHLYIDCKNMLRNLATTVVLQLRNHFLVMHIRLKNLHFFMLMSIQLLTNGKMWFGLMNLCLRLASIYGWHEFGIKCTKCILQIVYVLLSSPVTILSWYGVLSLALINLPHLLCLQRGGPHLILLTLYMREHYLDFISSMII